MARSRSRGNYLHIYSIASKPPPTSYQKVFLVFIWSLFEFLGSQKSELLSAPLTIHSGMFSSSTDVLQLLYETWCSSRAGGWRRQGLVIPWDLKRDCLNPQKSERTTADSGPAWCWKLPVGVCTKYTRDGRSVAIPLLTIFMENLWTLQEMGGRDWGFTYHTYKNHNVKAISLILSLGTPGLQVQTTSEHIVKILYVFNNFGL